MTSLGDGEFALTLFSAMAQEESNNLSKRVKWGKRINAEKGRVPPRVFGYDKVDNFTLAVNESEARIVRKIFSLYIDQGLGCRTISMELNRAGDKTKCGSDWNARGVRRILTNPLYSGTLINHKYEIEDFLTGKQVAVPEAERFYHQRPEWAIVTPEVFARTREVMELRRRHYDSGVPFREGRYSGRHAFSTLIKCAHCGRSFTRKCYTYVNTRVYWRCVTNDQYTAETCDNSVILDEAELLQALRHHISSRLGDPEQFADRALTALREQLPGADPDRDRKDAEGKQRRLLQKRSRYQELYANDLITLDELRTRLEPIARELAAVDSELAAPPSGSPQELEQHGRRVLEGLLSLETVKNSDMRRLIDHILVSRDGNVRVVLRKFDGMPET